MCEFRYNRESGIRVQLTVCEDRCHYNRIFDCKIQELLQESEATVCNEDECPHWSDWSVWGFCMAQCKPDRYSGMRSRFLKIFWKKKTILYAWRKSAEFASNSQSTQIVRETRSHLWFRLILLISGNPTTTNTVVADFCTPNALNRQGSFLKNFATVLNYGFIASMYSWKRWQNINCQISK